MKIFRVAEESLAPSWVATNKAMNDYDKVTTENIDRLNVTTSENITEEILVKECDIIEKCAASKTVYHYNSSWSQETMEHLKEYASAVGLDKSKMIGVNPAEMMKSVRAGVEESKMTKTASTETTIKEPSKLVLDPFHFERLSDTSHMEKKNWETIEKQLNLDDAPQMNMGVRPMRGGEDYLKNSDPKVAGNQNTISHPNKIKEMSESKIIDTGARLRQENIDKASAKVQERKDWEKNVIAAMEKKDIVPHGNVFPTEVMNAQSGLRNPSSQMGVYSKFDKSDIPELTEGEKIRESRKEWNDGMKRVAKEKATFEMSKHSSREISDTFGDELKKALKK